MQQNNVDRIERILGHVHLVNPFDGACDNKLKCFRCHRKLPEGMFGLLGPRFMKSGGKPLTALHPHCHTCRKQTKGKWIKHPLYTPELDRFWKSKLSFVRSGALNRSIFFAVDHEDLLGKYLEQEGRCALSGLLMEPFKDGNAAMKSGRNASGPSVDRIDSLKYYTPDNIQIVMQAVNTMKGELPQQVFVELCHQIANNRMFS